MILSDTDISMLLTIGAAASATYSLRIGGLLLSERLPKTGRFRKFMDALPGALLISLVAPGIVTSGLSGCFAAICTAFLTHRTGNVFISMISGVLIVALHRHLAF
jgi:uncharacterized membrane protein